MTLRTSNQQEHPSSDSSADQPSANSVGAEPSGPRGDNPATAGPGKTEVKSSTPENATGQINPSSPEDSNTTPGSVTKK